MRISTNWRRRERALLTAGATAAISAVAFGAGAAAAPNCESLAGKTFGDATITAATNVTPPFSVAGKDPPTLVAVKAPFCRVQGMIKPSADSDIKFEVWLPPEGSWNGKYQGVGNGGFAGSLIYAPMNWSLEAGYAVSGTDTGHSGGPLDADWALGHPEKIVDFGWRAIHETADVSKAIIEAYYGKAPARSYFSGCSDGGREALMEAQRFPKDYNGIVAGAPANFWTRLFTNFVWTEQALGLPGAWLSPEKLSIVTKAVLAACHGEGGYLDDPAQCRFDPSGLVCKSGQSDCLTEAEATALEKVYSGAKKADGTPINRGYPPGVETGQTAWELWITGSEPKRTAGSLIYGFATSYFRDMVYDTPDWHIGALDMGAEHADAVRATGAAVDFGEPGSERVQGRRRQADPVPRLERRRDPGPELGRLLRDRCRRLDGLDTVRSFYRLFVARGMEHCGGGPGPNAVGGVFGLQSPSRDPAHDVVAALAHWVEDGVAPDQIIGRATTTTIPPRASKPSVHGARIPRRQGILVRATEARRRATCARRRRSNGAPSLTVNAASGSSKAACPSAEECGPTACARWGLFFGSASIESSTWS